MANKLLPFADSGSNFLNDAEYFADPQRRTGNAPGRARSALVNKALRQVSLMVAAIGNFIDVRTAGDVTDDLDSVEMANLFTEALETMSVSVPSATTSLEGKVELATNAEVQAGTDGTRAVTPAGLASLTSTTGRRGLIETALESEVLAGTDNQRAITPLGLVARTATETRRGIVEMATVAEAEAMTDTERAVTPAGLAAMLGLFSVDVVGDEFSANLPGGLIIKGGQSSSAGNPPVVFDVPFPNVCFTVQCINDSTTNIKLTAMDENGFTIDASSAGINFWLAVGR